MKHITTISASEQPASALTLPSIFFTFPIIGTIDPIHSARVFADDVLQAAGFNGLKKVA